MSFCFFVILFSSPEHNVLIIHLEKNKNQRTKSSRFARVHPARDWKTIQQRYKEKEELKRKITRLREQLPNIENLAILVKERVNMSGSYNNITKSSIQNLKQSGKLVGWINDNQGMTNARHRHGYESLKGKNNYLYTKLKNLYDKIVTELKEGNNTTKIQVYKSKIEKKINELKIKVNTIESIIEGKKTLRRTK